MYIENACLLNGDVQTCDPNTQKLRQEDGKVDTKLDHSESETGLPYIERPHLKKQKISCFLGLPRGKEERGCWQPGKKKRGRGWN